MAMLIKYTVGNEIQFINLDHIVTARFREKYNPEKPDKPDLLMDVTLRVEGVSPNLQLTGEDALKAKEALKAACRETEEVLREEAPLRG